MKVDSELIKKVASVARLELSSAEVAKFVPQFKEMLLAFSKLDEVDVTSVEPSFHPVPLKNVLRSDTEGNVLSQEDALKNSTHNKDGYFKGPKAV